jgi:glutathionylspermidine synthase
MMWSNKGILPLLSKLDPTNPFLLHSSFEKPASGSYVKKPLLAREGANIEIVDRDVLASTGGDYGDEGYVYQEMYRLPETAPGVFPVIGSWIVDGEPCGMGIREDGLITKNTAKFVPHVIAG